MQKNFSYPLIVEDIAAAEKDKATQDFLWGFKGTGGNFTNPVGKIFQRRNLYQNEQKRTFAPGMGAG